MSLRTSEDTCANSSHDERSEDKHEAINDVPVDEDNNRIAIPDGGFWAWAVVAAFFAYNFSAYGSNSAYAVYLAQYLENNRFKGAGKLDYAAVGGLAFGTGQLFGPAIGFLTHSTCPQFVIGIGIILQGSGLLLAAFSTKLWQLYLTQGVLIGFGLASISMPAMTLVPQFFRKKRGIAMGIAASGSGLGGIIFNLGMERIMELHSVKWALITQCIMCTCLSGIALLFTRTRLKAIYGDKKPKYRFYDTQVLQSYGYWLIVCAVSFTMLGYVVLLYSMSAFTVSLGYSQKQGSIVSCMISVGALIGRPIVGVVADYIGTVSVGILAHTIVAIFSLAMWIPCRNFATALIFALIAGSFMGSIWTLLAPLITRVVGLPKMSACLDMIWIYVSLCGTTAPIIGLELRNNNSTSGNAYIKTALFSGFCYLGSALSLWVLRGLLVARDEVAMEEKTGFDDGELHLKVTFQAWSLGLFRFRNLPRKV